MRTIIEFQEVYLQGALDSSNRAKYHRCKNRRFNPGTCLICGLHFDVLLHLHAESHGFKDAYEMIDAGLVEFDYERYNKCKQKNC